PRPAESITAEHTQHREKDMRLQRIAVLAFLCAWCALTGAEETERRPAITTKISVVDGALPGDAALAPLAVSIRRYANLKVDVAAYDRLDGALADLARARGVSVVAQSADAAVRVEVDSTFYVYTIRFNARLVRLPEYADW